MYDTLYNGTVLLKRPSYQQPELNVLRKAGYNFSSKQYEKAWKQLSKNWKNLRFKKRKSFISYYIQKYLGVKKPDWKLARKMHKAYDYAFKDFGAEKALSKNAKNIIQWLAKHRFYIGVISDSNSLYGKKWLGKVKLSYHFHHISISCEIGYEKTTPKPFELFVKKINKKHKAKLKPEQCLVVDDSQTACRNAQKAGMKVALYDPFHRKKPNFKPEYQIHDIKEIKNIVQQNKKEMRKHE